MLRHPTPRAALASTIVIALAAAASARAQDETPLRIRSEPPGARVTLVAPGRRELGTTPLRTAMVPTGPVVLRFELDGHEPLEIHEDAIGRRTVSAVLVRASTSPPATDGGSLEGGAPEAATDVAPPATGHVSIAGAPAGALVLVDGAPRGALPLEIDLPIGAHRVRVESPSYTAIEREVVVAAEPQHVALDLPLAGAIEVELVGVDASIDGAPGPTAIVAPITTPGVHVLELRADGIAPVEVRCVLTAEAPRCVERRTWAAAEATLRVESEPEGAEVMLDGAPVGTTPWSGSTTPGPHVVELRAQGHRPAIGAVHLTPDGAVHTVALERAAPIGDDSLRTLRSAAPLRSAQGIVGASAGYPFLASIEGAVGLHDLVTVGAAARTFGRLTEIELSVRAGAWLLEALAIGGRVRAGGGGGPDADTAFGSLEGLLTVRPYPGLHLTAVAALDLHSDRYERSASDEQRARPRLVRGSRQDAARLRVAVAFDLALHERISLYGAFEGLVADGSSDGDPETTRALLGDLFGSGRTDPRLYGHLGIAIGL